MGTNVMGTNRIATNESVGADAAYPSVELAYDLAVNSYNIAQTRYDAIQSRIQTLLSFIATVSLAAPVLASNKNLTFNSRWFWSAVTVFFVALATGTFAWLRGHLIMIYPSDLYETWLDLDTWEFRKNLIWYAGKHFEANRDLINLKGRLAIITATLFFIELILLAAWVIAARS